MSEGEHKRAGVNTSSEGRTSTPRREAGEGTSHVQPNPAESSPAAREVCKGEGPWARPPASAGSGRPALASRPFHKQETVPGAAVSERPAPPEVVGPGASAQWTAPGAPRAADPWGRGFAQCGGMGKESLATEQRTGGRRLPSPAPPAEPGSRSPSRRSPAPKPSPCASTAPPRNKTGVPETSVPQSAGGAAQPIGVRGRAENPARPVPRQHPSMPDSAIVRRRGAVNPKSIPTSPL